MTAPALGADGESQPMNHFRFGTKSACALLGAACIAVSTLAPAATSDGPGLWVHPAIRGYGGVRPRPDLPSNLSPTTDYKVIVDVAHGDQDHADVEHSLLRLARLVNLMTYAGIPRDHVHIAAVIEGMAGYAVLTNEAYRKRFKVDNPNLALLHELKSSGVELMVCAQALAENSWSDGDVSPDVTVTLSALTDFVIYGQRGYSYLQL
jgi:intracellular sulfur oxidation DsrE/DsrF family protein